MYAIDQSYSYFPAFGIMICNISLTGSKYTVMESVDDLGEWGEDMLPRKQ